MAARETATEQVHTHARLESGALQEKKAKQLPLKGIPEGQTGGNPADARYGNEQVGEQHENTRLNVSCLSVLRRAGKNMRKYGRKIQHEDIARGRHQRADADIRYLEPTLTKHIASICGTFSWKGKTYHVVRNT